MKPHLMRPEEKVSLGIHKGEINGHHVSFFIKHHLIHGVIKNEHISWVGCWIRVTFSSDDNLSQNQLSTLKSLKYY